MGLFYRDLQTLLQVNNNSNNAIAAITVATDKGF